RAILDGFVVEAREHLANAEARLLDLEQSPRDAQVVNDLFRAFHSIKGVAGLLALGTVVRLTHALESLLDAARKGTHAISRASIDALLAARERLGAAVEAVAKSLEANAAEARIEDPEPLIATLGALLAGQPVAPPPPAAPSAPATVALPAPPPPGTETPLPSPRPGGASSAPAGVRVPMERLDSLVALVG